MKALLSETPLKNRLTGEFEDAKLFQGISTDNIAHVEGRWRPIFEQRKIEAKENHETTADINAEDAHWEWGKKALAAIRDPLTFEIFVLECAGNTQAIMLARKGGEKCYCRHPDHQREQLVYVDFLATAPWNRPKLVSEPVYKGCGRILISTAISLSIEEELEGRIGLHSLPGAEPFYRNQIGMEDLGKDDGCEGLRYFELPTLRAARMFNE